MGQLPIHLVGDGALLNRHNDMAWPFRQRRDVQVDLTIPTDPSRAEIDLEFVHGRAGSRT